MKWCGSWLGAIAVGLAISGCAGSPKPVFEQEAFGSTGTYSHAYASSPTRTCEAARRALLSQGYLIESSVGEEIKGHKNFQPEPEVHIQIAFSVVCAADVVAGPGKAARTLVFVNAVQDRYALKKSNNSASVGVSVLGSVSLPFLSSDDSLVKVASETIAADDFYARYFALVERYLAPGATPATEPKTNGGADISAPRPALSALTSAPASAQASAAASTASAPSE